MNKKTLSIALSIVFIFISKGCAPYTSTTPYSKTIYHDYRINIVDIDNHPLPNAKTVYSVVEFDMKRETNEIITDSTGVVKISVIANVDPKYKYIKSYSTNLDYEISKEGFYKQSGRLWSSFGGEYSSSSKEKSKTVTLIRPIDYLSPNFVNTPVAVTLKDKILQFIDLLLLESYLSESTLKTQSINLEEFKNEKYLKISFSSNNVYNSLQLNKYDIGKKLFDEIVRKILNPLNQYINDQSSFYGYLLTVYGATKSFTDEYATPDIITYQYYIPQEIVKKYKDKDISGQTLLDNSIILMDGERVEFKLQ